MDFYFRTKIIEQFLGKHFAVLFGTIIHISSCSLVIISFLLLLFLSPSWIDQVGFCQPIVEQGVTGMEILCYVTNQINLSSHEIICEIN